MAQNRDFRRVSFCPGIENVPESRFPESVILFQNRDFRRVSFCPRFGNFVSLHSPQKKIEEHVIIKFMNKNNSHHSGQISWCIA